MDKQQEILTPDERADALNLINQSLVDKGLVVVGYADDGIFFTVILDKE